MDATVTEDDVRYAFRLLLGRDPDPGGLRTYRAMVGSATVHELANALLASEEFRSTPMYRSVARDEHAELRLVEVEGFSLFVSPHDMLNRQLAFGGEYEPHLTAAITETLGPGMVFCDIGANIGYFSNLAAHVVGPSGRVLAFEALPDNVQLIRRSALVNGHDHLEVYAYAVGDRRAMHRYVRAQGTNGYIEPIERGDASALAATDLELVQGVRIDDVVQIPRLDVVKIDVEGAEWLALRGAAETITRTRPVLFSELCLGQLDRTSGVDGRTYLGMVRDWGYELDVVGFDGTIRSFGADVDAVVAHAAAQPEPHIDLRCRPA